MKKFLEQADKALVNFVNGYGKVLIVALVVFVVGLLIIAIVKKAVKKTSTKSRSVDNAAASFITSIIALIAYVVLLIVMIAALGFSTEGIIAALSSVMLAVALGLQGTLASLANGILLIFTKPFQAGDFVDIGGTSGTVKEVKLFCVKLVTGDNLTVVIPNNTVFGSTIINYSKMPLRRVDMVFSVAYGTDIKKVKQLLLDYVAKDERVEKNPAPFCRLTEHGDSALNITLRVWAPASEYWNIRLDYLEDVLELFAENGIEVPYNTIDVNVKTSKEA
ncbi:MAG: mechanosensitive ion channel [Clostridia bacterium]|nr:mechanosensitive ion channel [Clostridia bacterium]